MSDENISEDLKKEENEELELGGGLQVVKVELPLVSGFSRREIYSA